MAEVVTRVENDSIAIRAVDVRTEIRDGAGTVVASDDSRITVLPGEPAVCRQRLFVDDPSLWSPDSPSLYAAGVTLTDSDGDVDTEIVTFGIRSLRLDPSHGLRVNGEIVKLRGACVHHDNGVLGAATFARAEERRVELLKDAGFNAIRMSHNPMSKAMLNACDRLGMLVVDEAFDMWTSGKNEFDYSLNFPEWWERDIEAMVAKDFNHPSVIMYSIGNEIPETGSPSGAAWGRELAEKVRSLDHTRYVTNGINGMLAVMADLASLRKQAAETVNEGAGINTLMADPAQGMNAIGASELVTRRTAESFAVLDVAGMNYMEARYAPDRELFPNRIILGTESFTTRIDGIWRLVKQHGHVIGDFAWTGWDYLGEVGIGRPQYLTPDAPRASFAAPYPHLLAESGDIDITGHRRPASYYREIVFGLRTRPYLAVKRPQHQGRPSPAPLGPGATRSPAGPGPASRARRSPSRSTATRTRWNSSSTDARWGGNRWERTTVFAPSSTRRTSPANFSQSPTGTAPKPAVPPCVPRPARWNSAPRPTGGSSPRPAATLPTSPSP